MARISCRDDRKAGIARRNICDGGALAASVIASDALASAAHDLSVTAMLEPITAKLGYTLAIARKSCVHPTARHPGRVERGLVAPAQGTPAARAG